MSAIFDNNVVGRWVATAGTSAMEVFGWAPPAEGATLQVTKRRAWTSGVVARLANVYFSLAGAPVRFFLDSGTWQRAEVDCFRMLNGPARAHRQGDRAISADRLPGESYLSLARRGRLTWQAVRAAAREFRHAHHMLHPCTGMPFTHGDATLANMVYDPVSDRARLIDFETFHVDHTPLSVRRADDLAVFVLDILSLAEPREALGLALAFLREYGDRHVWEALPERLARPRGLGWFFWKVRTNFVSARYVMARVAKLEEIVSDWTQSAAVTAVPPAGASAA